ncbi:Lipoamide acyltransferase component of branched-chain alpha-keto acid dehydrogenase complex [Forsythia ovata]|uniref:Dihydrolipoamide acetyltransferase component of pyruvate dehydrogenase complex n=1 Tax=Forsythia ovata TaxID=205694 RepID=A0ABD1P7G5_9LAMI
MICRKIYQKKLWSSGDWWRWTNSSIALPSTAAGGGAQKTYPILGSLSQPQAQFFTHPATSFRLNGDNKIDSWNVPFGMKRCCFTTLAVADLPVNGIVDVPLAQTGEGIAECELIKWFVKEGDQVEEFQPLCEVQSDKANIEITSRYRGKVALVLHVPGNIIKVGETLLKMSVDDNAPTIQSFEGSETIKAPDSNIYDSDSHDSRLGKAEVGGILSTPAVRNLAKQLGVNLEDVHGTGKDGRVLREDVHSYAAQKGIFEEGSASIASSAKQFLGGDDKHQNVLFAYGWEYEDKTIPLRGFQRAMAKSMTLAAKIPHFHYVEDINCDALVKLKSSFQNENSEPDVKHTFLPILIKLLSMALSRYPLLNSCFNEELQEVSLKGSHNIGIAMATPYGLVVPNIKKVQSLSILEITKELSRLQQLALANKLNPDDISGGTITLSNIGAIGGKFGSPLINVPEVSIIAVGRIQKIPQFAEDGSVYPASIMTVNIGADHRVLDGATVARFCNEWKLFIEKPELLMLHMK